MSKKDLIREINEKANKIFELGREIETLNKKIYIYKEALEITRDFYGEKLMDLESRRLLLDHPDIVVEGIIWDPVEKHNKPKDARYSFVYGIKGERQ